MWITACTRVGRTTNAAAVVKANGPKLESTRKSCRNGESIRISTRRKRCAGGVRLTPRERFFTRTSRASSKFKSTVDHHRPTPELAVEDGLCSVSAKRGVTCLEQMGYNMFRRGTLRHGTQAGRQADGEREERAKGRRTREREGVCAPENKCRERYPTERPSRACETERAKR